MNNSIREMIGVNAVSIEITRNVFLKGEIPTNDKSVSWDGEIQIYNEKSHHKSTLFGRVPVQVKSRKVKHLNKDKIKYSLNKNDIRNYYHDGGVLFFIVEFIDTDQKKVYYDALLPFDLKEIIEKMKNQKSISHEFNILPSENDALDTICRHFIINSKKQSQNVLSINVSDINRNGTIVIPTVSPNLSTMFDYPAYVYSKEEYYNLEIPIKKIHIFEIIQETDLQIGVNGEIYYTNATKRIEKDRTIIEFGDSFKMEIQRGTELNIRNLNINFTRSGPIKERLKDTKFMVSILIAKHIEVMGSQIIINTVDHNVITELTDLIRDLEELDKLFDELNVSFEQPFNNLKVADFRNMERLRDIILYQNYNELDLKQTGFLKQEIGNITILLAVTKKNGEWSVFNAFESEKLFRIVASKEPSGPGFEISPYMMVEVKQLFKMANFNLQELEKSFLKIDYDTDSARQYVNYYLLDIIHHYDEVDQDKEILDFAKKMYEHLVKFEGEKDETYFLNVMQIVKRQRKYTQEEIAKIINRKNKATDPFIICGYLALLGNRTEFDFYFSQLSEEDQDSFKVFPIYKLVEGN
ncbi:DUF4365 domain-containing protein [Bacillus sp. FJAT-50079]|uniref:DUF4365 domain-containing protein n=1 Tax=Bacillus sp. FJAT-50079 TaxID=2833577 RepID=UPI001BC9FDE7|nr:DUF4365 domain-containing protein [Bacillus sp. FJAT-50079]MBS4207202.1 DUF4365 domain-containing protein [Bacillus sp. FJAT-50079]